MSQSRTPANIPLTHGSFARTLANFPLTRAPGFDDFYEHTCFDFITPQVGPTPYSSPGWAFRYVQAQNYDENPDLEVGYAVSLSRNAMVFFNVFLEENGTRLTDMRLWELIIDSWIFEGGNPNSLRYIGLADIINPVIVRQIKREIGDQVSRGRATRGQQEQVTVEPGCLTWKENPFIRCCENVARGLRGIDNQAITVTRAHLTWLEGDPRTGGENLYMVVELSSSSDTTDDSKAQGTPNAKDTSDTQGAPNTQVTSTKEAAPDTQNAASVGQGGSSATTNPVVQSASNYRADSDVRRKIDITVRIRDHRNRTSERCGPSHRDRVGGNSRVTRNQPTPRGRIAAVSTSPCTRFIDYLPQLAIDISIKFG